VAYSAGGITSLHGGCCYSFAATGGQIQMAMIVK